jgi:serine protease Do/serine protease DegQ
MKSIIAPLFILLFLLKSGILFSQGNGFTLKVDDTELDRSLTSAPSSYSFALKKATPAVVAVTTQQMVRRLYPGNALNPRDDFLRRYFGLPNLNAPRIQEELVPAGIGSGVIVSPEGHTITNAHVITDPRTGELVREVTIQLSDKQEFQAKIIGFDRSTDVAVLKIEADEPLPHVSLANSDRLEVGDVVFAAGNPLGIGMTVTMGIISATKRSELGVLDEVGSYENFIQTDAAINRGNSGGPLLDSRGRLIGINTAIISQTGSSIGIGLAIPVNMVKKVLTDLVEVGGVRRGFLGVELSATADSNGAVVEKIYAGTAADLAGFKPKDRIIKVGSQSVDSINQSRLAISQTTPGTQLPIEVIRGGEKIVLFVTLDVMGGKKRISIPGVSLEALSSENRLRFQIPSTAKGVVVTESTGMEQTFKKGVVIVEINGFQVNSVKEVEEQIKSGINRFYVWYRNKYRFLAYRVP